MSQSQTVWKSGVPLGDLIAVEPLSNRHQLELLLASTGRDKDVIAVACPEVSEFLAVHRAATLLCRDAPKLHWLLDSYLRAKNHIALLKTWWTFSKEGRLVDVSLMNRELDCIRSNKLAYSFRSPNDDDDALDPFVNFPGPFLPLDPKQVKSIWSEFQVRQGGFADPDLTRITPDSDGSLIRSLMRRCVACGLIADVQGHIAIRRIFGIRVDRQRWGKVQDDSRAAYRHASSHLAGDVDATRSFKWKGEEIDQSRHGSPRANPQKLAKWFDGILDDKMSLQDWYGHSAVIPQEGMRRSQNPDDWGVWCSCHPLLAKWRDLFRYGHIACLNTEGDMVHPVYTVLPTIRAGRPHVNTLRSLGAAIMARPGKHLLLVKPISLSVRCWAVLCRQRGYSTSGSLYESLRENDEKSCSGSRWLADASVAISSVSPKTVKPEDLVIALLDVLPLGLSPTATREFLAQEHNIELDATNLAKSRTTIADHVAPELLDWLPKGGKSGEEQGRTLAGRATPVLPHAQCRQQEYLLSVDEVRKRMLYNLVESQYCILAVTEREILLEMPEGANRQEEQQRLSELLRHAEGDLLRELAREPAFEWQEKWRPRT